ncbi:MAG: DNA gyrase subunit A, partial [Minisyncoccales bacterium]
MFEGDGSVKFKIDKRHKGKSIELTYNSKSQLLINQLKTVLLNFGIASTKPYKDKRNNCYKLIISGNNAIKKFKKEIDFFSTRKKEILENLTTINSTRMSKTDFIPHLNKYLRDKYNNTFIKRNNFDRYNNLIKNKNKLMILLDSKDKKLINFLLKNKFLFNKIKTITKSTKKEYVYSVKVNSKCHSFTANGFINHNTEAKLSKISAEIMEEIEKDTVDFVPNFDDSLKEPKVLPARLPALLLNGASGIAVGMATSIPPHNIHEIAKGIIETIKNPEIEITELMDIIKGPDFPTGGIIQGKSGIIQAYSTGRGKIKVRAKHHFEEKKGKSILIFDEIPYQVNKSMLITQIADNVKDKVIEGISDIRDESDKEGMRIVIELKREANKDVVVNQIFKHTRCQTTFSINMLALVDDKPQTLKLKEIIEHYIEHRKDVIKRRTQYELDKAEKRAHILKGLMIALKDIDKVIELIKKSENAKEANLVLTKNFALDEIQANAILEMQLQKLTGLEQEKLKSELEKLVTLIEELKAILASEQKILDIITEELENLDNKYSDERKTEISETEDDDFLIEDLIKPENTVITISHVGYIKKVLLTE